MQPHGFPPLKSTRTEAAQASQKNQGKLAAFTTFQAPAEYWERAEFSILRPPPVGPTDLPHCSPGFSTPAWPGRGGQPWGAGSGWPKLLWDFL